MLDDGLELMAVAANLEVCPERPLHRNPFALVYEGDGVGEYLPLVHGSDARLANHLSAVRVFVVKLEHDATVAGSGQQLVDGFFSSFDGRQNSGSLETTVAQQYQSISLRISGDVT